MAEVVVWPFIGKGRSGNSKYPWDEWLDGRPWRLVQGTDFRPAVKNFRAGPALREAAYKRGLRVRTHLVDEQTLIIQAYKP